MPPGHHRPGQLPPDGPCPRVPRRPLPGACRSSCPPRPSNLRAARPPQPPARAPRERGRPEAASPGPDSGPADRTYLPRRRAGEGGELSAAPAGVRWARGARAFKTLPRDSARWCQAGRALSARHPRGHPAPQPAPGGTRTLAPPSAPRRARSSGVEPEARGDRMGGDLGTHGCSRGRHPSYPLYSSFGRWRNFSSAGCWGWGKKRRGSRSLVPGRGVRPSLSSPRDAPEVRAKLVLSSLIQDGE